jgi:hypothetical protein
VLGFGMGGVRVHDATYMEVELGDGGVARWAGHMPGGSVTCGSCHSGPCTGGPHGLTIVPGRATQIESCHT